MAETLVLFPPVGVSGSDACGRLSGYPAPAASAEPVGATYVTCLVAPEKAVIADVEEEAEELSDESIDAYPDQRFEMKIKKPKRDSDSDEEPFEEPYQDHYAVLKLKKRWRSTDAEILKSYRKLVLKTHPDRNPHLTDDTKFKAVQRAFDVLEERSTRQAFDSSYDVDDSLPSAAEVRADFYDALTEVFERNARWSVKQPCPPLGDDNSSDDYVQDFYNFWGAFSSWRDYSNFIEHNVNNAEDRMERRHMERQNVVEQKKMKKAEIARMRELVDLAQAHDPRIKRRIARLKAEKQAAKDAKKKVVEDRKKAAKDRERLAREAAEAEEEKKRKEAKAIANKRKQAANEIKQARKRFRKLGAALELDVVALDKVASQHVCELEILIARFGDCLESGNKEQASEVLAAAVVATDEGAKLPADERATINEEKDAARNAREWTDADKDALAKALAAHAVGGADRLEKVAAAVGKDLSDVASMVDEPRKLAAQAAAAKAAEEAAEKEKKEKEAGKKGKKGKQDTTTEEKTETVWTDDDIAALKQAVAKYPDKMQKKKRWAAIASEMGTKTSGECSLKYNELQEAKKAKNKGQKEAKKKAEKEKKAEARRLKEEAEKAAQEKANAAQAAQDQMASMEREIQEATAVKEAAEAALPEAEEAAEVASKAARKAAKKARVKEQKSGEKDAILEAASATATEAAELASRVVELKKKEIEICAKTILDKTKALDKAEKTDFLKNGPTPNGTKKGGSVQSGGSQKGGNQTQGGGKKKKNKKKKGGK